MVVGLVGLVRISVGESSSSLCVGGSERDEMATKGAVTTAMAIAGRALRACDVCANKSASWYCGADTAYLCDRCDTQVHSANSLSLRHERARLTPSGHAPARKPTNSASPPTRKRSISKILHDDTRVPQVLPSRKRSRTTRPRPYPHHRQQQSPLPNPEPKQQEQQEQQSSIPPKQSSVKSEAEELLTFDDLFDTEDFLVVDDDDTQEVPSLSITVSQSDNYSSSSFDIFSPDFHAVSSPSEDSNLAACFKGNAAHDDDHFLVPDNELDAGIDPLSCDVDGGIPEACFIPGEIPDLDGFEDFGSRELGSLSFDLELPADETGSDSSSPSNVVETETDRFANGPFAKFFASRPTTTTQQLSPESIKCEAKEILRCCREGMSEEDLRVVPSLRLNYNDVITAWSDRGEPWVNPDGLVPDMSPGREARVLRYKEKRRSRLFSKTIRYEVRKLNAERRPRMKGRFVKRTSSL